ncbi:hypothetical protein SAZ_39890 [Streptomyces noursei ZPM]|nr:hypothetical protein SAZ_39890 [Streptomyces noursei ZPM]EPY92856.1 hypothetical protein K530_51110 [Streptomyces noursei CCRC 11814]MCZ0972070.1 hypothetical protein [Streptomyces noursei]
MTLFLTQWFTSRDARTTPRTPAGTSASPKSSNTVGTATSPGEHRSRISFTRLPPVEE